MHDSYKELILCLLFIGGRYWMMPVSVSAL